MELTPGKRVDAARRLKDKLTQKPKLTIVGKEED